MHAVSIWQQCAIAKNTHNIRIKIIIIQDYKQFTAFILTFGAQKHWLKEWTIERVLQKEEKNFLCFSTCTANYEWSVSFFCEWIIVLRLLKIVKMFGIFFLFTHFLRICGRLLFFGQLSKSQSTVDISLHQLWLQYR